MVTLNLFVPGKFDHAINFPSAWDELTCAEMELVAKEHLTNRENPYTNKVFILSSIINLRAANQNIKLPATWQQMLNYDDAATQGLDAISFLFDNNGRTVNPYPVLTVKNKPLLGPKDDFNSILCGEMEDCDIYLFKFNEEAKAEYLAQIASILWRPRNATYKPEASEKMMPHFLKLPVHQLFVIYTWYTGCRNNLPRYFPDVFNGGSSGAPDITAFTKCIHAGAGPKNGSRENIRKMLAKEFLFDMQLEAETAKKIKEQYEHH